MLLKNMANPVMPKFESKWFEDSSCQQEVDLSGDNTYKMKPNVEYFHENSAGQCTGPIVKKTHWHTFVTGQTDLHTIDPDTNEPHILKHVKNNGQAMGCTLVNRNKMNNKVIDCNAEGDPGNCGMQ